MVLLPHTVNRISSIPLRVQQLRKWVTQKVCNWVWEERSSFQISSTTESSCIHPRHLLRPSEYRPWTFLANQLSPAYHMGLPLTSLILLIWLPTMINMDAYGLLTKATTESSNIATSRCQPCRTTSHLMAFRWSSQEDLLQLPWHPHPLHPHPVRFYWFAKSLTDFILFRSQQQQHLLPSSSKHRRGRFQWKHPPIDLLPSSGLYHFLIHRFPTEPTLPIPHHPDCRTGEVTHKISSILNSYTNYLSESRGKLHSLCRTGKSLECGNLLQHLSRHIETLPHPLQLEFLLSIQHPPHSFHHHHPTSTILQLAQSDGVRQHHHLHSCNLHSHSGRQNASFGDCRQFNDCPDSILPQLLNSVGIGKQWNLGFGIGDSFLCFLFPLWSRFLHHSWRIWIFIKWWWWFRELVTLAGTHCAGYPCLFRFGNSCGGCSVLLKEEVEMAQHEWEGVGCRELEQINVVEVQHWRSMLWQHCRILFSLDPRGENGQLKKVRNSCT